MTNRPIEIDGPGWCPDDQGYVGVICFPPDDENPWTILHEETGPSFSKVEAALKVARNLPSWPCRYCSEWMLKQTSMFLKNGVCEVCLGAKLILNPDYL